VNYYKITNQDEIHHKLQYKTGLNVDVLPFNPSGDCQNGGIYFSREDILAFLHYGPWIRKVTIPEDAKVYENPGSPKKWKADKVILGRRSKITTKKIKQLIEEGADLRVNNSGALRWAAWNGHLGIVKLLLKAGADPKVYNGSALLKATSKGHLKIVKLLLKAGVDPKTYNSYALRWAANNGYLEIVKLLLGAGADPRADNSSALRWAAENGHIEVVKLLIKAGIDLKTNGRCALRWAAENGHLKIVKLLEEAIETI
jgi:ankyrin repeat protein